MIPMNDTDRQKLLLQQEIAKLSGAISRHAPSSTSSRPVYHPYSKPTRGVGAYRGVARGSGGVGRGRGRGRGGSNSLDLRALNKTDAPTSITPTTAPATTEAVASTSTLTVAVPEKSEKEEGEVSPSPPSDHKGKGKAPEAIDVVAVAKEVESWVKGKSRSGNMSLMTVEKSKHLKSLPPKPRRTRVPPSVQVLSSTSTAEGPQRVVIDGVIFQFEPGGSKLTRVGELETKRNSPKTRRKLKFEGKSFRRTSLGNLISSSSKAEQATKPCRYFTKTGRCNRALTCPYAHDPTRLAICPKFLRDKCPLTAETCPLSHSPSAHNTPSCVHFQTSSTCRNPTCPYPHVKVAPDAPVCAEFTKEGWCPVPPGACPNAHVWECGEWRETGKCSKGGKCGLRHILRAEKGRKVPVPPSSVAAGQQAQDAEVVGDVLGEPDPLAFEGQAEFIGFGDQGSPEKPSTESESEEEEEALAEPESGEADEEGDVGMTSDEGEEEASSEDEESDSDEDEDVLGVVV